MAKLEDLSDVMSVELTVASPARPGDLVEVTFRGERYSGRVTGGMSRVSAGKATHTATADLVRQAWKSGVQSS